MNKILPCAVAVLMLAVSPAVRAEDPKPDDRVTFDLAAEDWVTTQTARVVVTVDAAVAGASAATMRGDMVKAVNNLAKAEWKLTNFSRGQDNTGLERWNASYEARLPEAALGGLHDAAKKASKAGMQLTVNEIDFSPTLAEMETVRTSLRTQLTKQAAEQLTAINAAMPGRSFRVGAIDFGAPGMVPAPMMMRAMSADKAMAMESFAPAAPMERAQKVTMAARVTYNAVAPK